MCDPLTAGSMALSAAGSYMQAREGAKNAGRATAAKNRVFQEGMDRQQGYANEAQEAYRPMVQGQGAEAFGNKMAQSVGSREQAFNDARIAPPAYNFSAPKNVQLAMEQAFGDKGAETQRNTDALARLGAYGDTQSNMVLDRNAYARVFGNLADKAQGDVRLLPNAMNAAANNSQKSGSFLPTLMQMAGGAGTMVGAGGGKAFGRIIDGGQSGMIPFGAKDLGTAMPWKGGPF